MEDIRVDVGVDTLLHVDLSEFDFLGVDCIIFTIKNVVTVKAEPIVERHFYDAKVHDLIITANESAKLKNGAQYDFQKLLLDGTRIKISDNGNITLRMAVGDKVD